MWMKSRLLFSSSSKRVGCRPCNNVEINLLMIEILAMVQYVLGTNIEALRKPRLPQDPPVQTLADISDATELGWTPKIDLEEGIRSMVPYIKAAIAEGAMK